MVYVFLLMLLSQTPTAMASLQDHVGYSALQDQLGVSGMPDGSSVSVLQVEAGEAYFPNTADAQFVSGVLPKTFVNLNNNNSNGAQSTHSTSVGRYFYGNNSSLSPEIHDIGIYSANGFLDEVLNNTNSNSDVPMASARRLANHSWVGGYYVSNNGAINLNATARALKRLDWLIDNDDMIQVVGTNNGSVSKPLLATAFNVICVGRTDGIHANTSVSIDSFYSATRPIIHLVAPQSTVSASTPTISSAVSLLLDGANNNSHWSAGSTINRAGSTIYSGQKSETIKAVLMAGASRFTINSGATGADIVDYRQDVSQQTDNGLDWRYGAGQLNIQHSYQILSSGEQASKQDAGSTLVQTSGYDYDPAFGGDAGSNDVGDYDLGLINMDGFLAASLVWNADITGPPSPSSTQFSYNASVEKLKLSVFSIATNGTESLIEESISSVSNTQNIWLEVNAGGHYKLRIEAMTGSFKKDYALAWQIRAFNDFDQDGSFDHLDSNVTDPCVPTRFTSPCLEDSDVDGLSDFVEGEFIDSDLDGLFDYLESNILDSDADGFMDNVDLDNQDPCVPDFTACSVNIPVLPPSFYYILTLLLAFIAVPLRFKHR